MRFFFGLPFAAIVTAGLFLVMGAAVRSETVQVDEYRRTVDLTVTPQIDEDGRVIPKEVPVHEGHRAPIPDLRRLIICVWPPRTEKPQQTPVQTVRIAPPYPPSCNGNSGTVTVRFDLSDTGTVMNERVIRSSDSCFNKNALWAVSRWKYDLSSGGNRATRSGIEETIGFRAE